MFVLEQGCRWLIGGAFIRGVLNYSIISPLWILKLFTLQKGGGVYSGEYGTFIHDVVHVQVVSDTKKRI